MRRRFRRVALAVSAVVVVAIAGGVTYAGADIGGGGVINGCLQVAERLAAADGPGERQLSPERDSDLVESDGAARAAGTGWTRRSTRADRSARTSWSG
jgi:hypothetical protein